MTRREAIGVLLVHYQDVASGLWNDRSSGDGHGRRKGVALQPRMVRVPLYPVAQADVEHAIRWLDEHWGGAVFLPDALRELVAVA